LFIEENAQPLFFTSPILSGFSDSHTTSLWNVDSFCPITFLLSVGNPTLSSLNEHNWWGTFSQSFSEKMGNIQLRHEKYRFSDQRTGFDIFFRELG
jgi:hypothetical protein